MDAHAGFTAGKHSVVGRDGKAVLDFGFDAFGSALGRSILLMSGMISRLAFMAIMAFATVCASTPWVASTTSTAPSHAARLRLTS